MKTLMLFLLISLNIFAQSNVILLFGSGATPPVSGFDPSDLSPVLDLRYGVGITADANGKVTAWTDGTYTFTQADTSMSPYDVDSCLFFVTGQDRKLMRADDNAFDITGSMDVSFEAWIWATGVGRIFTNRGSAPFWVFQLADNDGAKFGTYFNDGSNASLLNDTSIVVGGWHHIVIVLDRSVGVDIYVDGTLKSSEHTTEWTNREATDYSADQPTGIGRPNSDNPEGFGYISDLRFYHSALSSSDVTDLYNFGRSQ